MNTPEVKQFSVVSGETVNEILYRELSDTIQIVKDTYLTHKNNNTVNPDSYFLKFPNQPKNRIIALPASISDEKMDIAGIKWIASFPENIDHGLPRASALLILNSLSDGYPYACVEASSISSVRTAASAVLGAYWLNNRQRKVRSISFIGSGIIGKTIYELFDADNWDLGNIKIYDLHQEYAESFKEAMLKGSHKSISLAHTLDEALEADMVVLATTTATPYIKPPIKFKPGQIILNISLRDIDPELVLDSWNIVDDVDHCLKASTSPHLAEQLQGNREFITGTLAELMEGEIALDEKKPKIYSPFGMGILDLALADNVYQKALEEGKVTPIPHFFSHTKRW